MKTTILAAACALGLAGLSTADTINVPGDYPTVDGAFNAANTGDTITIDAGVYEIAGQLVIDSNTCDLTVLGATNKDGTPATTLVPGGAGNTSRCFLMSYACGQNRIENLIIDQFYGSSVGQAIEVQNVDATFNNCIFRNNVSTSQVVVYVNSTCSDCEVEFTQCVFEGNVGRDAGVFRVNYAGSTTFDGCTFIGNESTVVGPGVGLLDSTDMHMIDCVLEGNIGVDYGGALYIRSTGIFITTLERCVITGNEARYGGGIAMNSDGNQLVLVDTIVSANQAVDGGGIYISADSSVSGGDVFGNTAQYGGGIYINADTALLIGATVRDNVALFNGGGVYTAYDVDDYPDVIATTVCGNTPNQVWHIEGDATNIINESCSSNPAACCVNGACIMVEPLMCDDVGGTLSNGGEEDCSSTECAEPCLGDVNNDSEINVNDLLTVIANWGGCP